MRWLPEAQQQHVKDASVLRTSAEQTHDAESLPDYWGSY
jgi:hypothetical protein